MHKKGIRDKENENRSNDIGHQVDGASANAVIIEKEVVSEGHDSKSTTECAGCAQKAIERDEWKEKYNQEVEKRKELKKVYVNTTISFTELYSKYNALLKTSASTHQSVDDAASSGQDIFTPAEVKFLQCTSLEKKTDCTFINHCLKYAYKVDRSVLVFKTLKGTSEWTEINGEGVEIQHAAKTPLTPKKVERIKGLFYERLSKCEIDAVEYSERIKDSYVNKLIAAGIKNLSKKFK